MRVLHVSQLLVLTDAHIAVSIVVIVFSIVIVFCCSRTPEATIKDER